MDPQLAALDAATYGEPPVLVPQQQPPSQPLPQQAEVDEFLRKKRKAREHKACYPCRQRKVKCDLSRPCQTCRDREHPELCDYHPPSNKRQNVGDASSDAFPISAPVFSPHTVTIGRNELDMLFQKLDGLENSITELRQEMQRNTANGRFRQNTNGSVIDDHNSHSTHTDVHGLHARNQAGDVVHVGGGSVPAMLYSFSQGHSGDGDQQQLTEFLGKSVLPLFGLDDESSFYPFSDLWGLPPGGLQRARELAKALPQDSQLLSLFRSYCDMGAIIYPAIADLKELEHDLSVFIYNRSLVPNPEDGVTEQEIYGKGYVWLGMLFAVLASGAQCSNMKRKERELTSQVYVCCGFECLRFTNFFSQPKIESVQALLVIGNVMTNNMNANAAWSLLGLTIRLAQGLGLHQACPPYVPNELILPRSKVWWAIVWQDSLLSITYDRSASLNVRTMEMPQHYGTVPNYHASMYRISRVVIDIVSDRSRSMSPRELVSRIQGHCDEMSVIMRDAAEHLRDSRACSSDRETLEHWALYLHKSYAMAELCRSALNMRFAADDAFKPYRQLCIDNLVNTLEAFLGLNEITTFAQQSWAALSRGLSSALLLGILGEHNRNERAQRLFNRFLVLISELTSSINPEEISAPVQRGLDALKKLQLDGPQELHSIANAKPGAANPGGLTGESQLGVDQTQMLTPAYSDSAAAEPDDSPHSVLNSILWGRKVTAHNMNTYSMA